MGRTQEHVQANSFSLKIMSSVTICCDSEEHPLFHLETISFGCTTYFALTLNNQKLILKLCCDIQGFALHHIFRMSALEI
jgi:hypothetical protein